MQQHAFDAFVRRAADLFDRRSLLGALSGALLAAESTSLSTYAKNKGKKSKKKCKRGAKFCRSDILEVCDRFSGDERAECQAGVKRCCNLLKKCKPEQVAIDCCENEGWCL